MQEDSIISLKIYAEVVLFIPMRLTYLLPRLSEWRHPFYPRESVGSMAFIGAIYESRTRD